MKKILIAGCGGAPSEGVVNSLIYKDIALYNEFPKLEKKINPLPEGLLWMRGMDARPKLVTEEEINKEIIKL